MGPRDFAPLERQIDAASTRAYVRVERSQPRERPVPLTVKLSRKFYDKFGGDVVDELVTILNAVDASYRLELGEQNEANFARFEAKLDQRIAEAVATLREEMAALRADIIKWMFVFWIGTMATTVGLVFAVVSLLR